ncbi:hypothetical protein ACWGB8_34790 [Kitasatospora sp. NPDC054939]
MLQTTLASTAGYIAALLSRFDGSATDEVSQGRELIAARFAECLKAADTLAAKVRQAAVARVSGLDRLAESGTELTGALRTTGQRLDAALQSLGPGVPAQELPPDALRAASSAWAELHDRVTSPRLE